MSLDPGAKLGRYEIRSQIGEGGMGEVYLAQDTRLDRTIALKILPTEVSNDPHRMRRFVQEAKATSALNHPNILTIHEIDESESIHFIATEFVDGQTLRDHMLKRQLKLSDVIDLATQITGALAAAHAAGIIHRDVKPENIMVRQDGIVKVLDFGLAKFSATEDPMDPQAPTRELLQTQPGVVQGTAAYMSPEQARGLKLDARSDLFSLGIVLYEMIAGQKPFTGATVADLFVSLLEKPHLPLTEHAAPVPLELVRLVDRCLQKQRELRPASASELLADLKAVATKLSQPCPVQSSMPSIAVLPFRNVSADPENEYFCDGLAEELLGALARISTLRVAARTSAFFFKGKEIDIREIGEKLNVTTVLEGSVRKTDARLRISVQLIDVTNGFQVWTEQYDRQSDDVFAIQEEIAREIAEKLQLKLTGKEKELLTSRPTENPIAYRHYLKGRYYWNRFTEEGFRKAAEQFELALAEEPSYGQAYSGLADSYIELGFFSYVSPHDAFPKAKAAAKKALAIDSGLAEAHFSMAHCSFYYEWNWEEAERRYKRAIELAPREPTGRQKYGFFLAAMGRYDEALKELKIAQEVDPLSPFYATTAAIVLFHARRAEEGIEICGEVLDDHPEDAWTRWVLAWHLQILGNFENAVSEAQTAFAYSRGNAQFLAVLGHAYALNGQREEAQKVLEQLEERKTRSHTSPFLLALVCAGLGQKEDAFRHLSEAFDERTGWMVWLRSYPPFDTISEDPRYKDLSNRVGLH